MSRSSILNQIWMAQDELPTKILEHTDQMSKTELVTEIREMLSTLSESTLKSHSLIKYVPNNSLISSLDIKSLRDMYNTLSTISN